MEQFLPLSVYGVSISHPSDWKIFINPNTKFTFDEGQIKIDKVKGPKEKSTSLTIRWAKMNHEITLDEYIEELEQQFKKKEKKSRNKDRYSIVEKTKCMVNGVEAFLLHQEFVANHSIYRILGKDELVKVLQIMIYSKNTQRMIVASLLTTPEELKENEQILKEILFSLREETNEREKTELRLAK